MFGRAASLCTILLLAAGCSQRVEPEEEYREGSSGRPTLSPEMVPGALSDGPAAAPAMPAGPAATADGSGEAIRGEVRAPADGAAAGAALFLYVRAAGVEGGPPLAVQRHPAGALPLEFAIGPESAMIPGTVFPGRVTVEARLDADGDAATRSPDDRVARSEPLAPGAEGVELVLSRP